ncbi:MAG: DUF3291 domain-containing protein [Roseitalea porphyridii]|uniref:DUF3291 domain-containing protein n=1 Tax=Roseitalea porphyridii TaxID=1852022 RepID=UPI0032EDC8BB
MLLAEANIARAKKPLDDPAMADFVARIDQVNAVAERSDGFVWRYQVAEGNTLAMGVFDDPMVIFNMSVWETPRHLEHYVWNTVHKHVYRRRAEWFDAIESHRFAMWWVEDGRRPSPDEARQRLDHLNLHGNTDHAFDWAHLPHVKLWQSQRCA